MGSKMMSRSLGFLGLLLIALILVSALVETAEASPKMCLTKCRVRCKTSKIKWKCFKNCNLCCRKCRCVPAFGHPHQCPCYHHNKKCP